MCVCVWRRPGARGRHSTFFSGTCRGVQPEFPKCGACDLIISSERGGPCDLKISKFGGLRAEIWAKIEVVVALIPHFFSKAGGTCELTIA